MTTRKEQAQKTRENIVQAVNRLISIKDFELITVQDITSEAKVAKGSFYTYFKRKEDVLYELGWTPFIELEQELNSMKDKTIDERLKFYIKKFMEGVEVYGINICRGWVRDVINPQYLNQNKWEFDVKTLCDFFQKAVKNGELSEDTPIETLAHIINSQLYGMMTSWCMSDGKFEPLDWVDKFCETQLKQILAPYIK
jgi:AcrR family transcriptional regulator